MMVSGKVVFRRLEETRFAKIYFFDQHSELTNGHKLRKVG